MRDIRDYKASVRPDSQSLGSASPFNVITEGFTLRTFTQEEIAVLYAQHTAKTGQKFADEAVAAAFEYSGGQPYLVNALARWCVEKIHNLDYSQIITAADMHEAKEKIIREQGTHLDSLMERMKEPRVRQIVEPVMLGEQFDGNLLNNDLQYVLDLGILKNQDNRLVPANPMYSEIIGRYLSRPTQDRIACDLPQNPWVDGEHLDMPRLLKAFQQFWRENADEYAVPFEYREAYPHLVLQAFLQRVINGGGEIIREMALGKKALDLGVHFHKEVYAVEVKTLKLYRKSPDAAKLQILGYMDRLGVPEGWLVVFDPDMTKNWDEKISAEDLTLNGKTVHLLHC